MKEGIGGEGKGDAIRSDRHRHTAWLIEALHTKKNEKKRKLKAAKEDKTPKWKQHSLSLSLFRTLSRCL